MKILFPGAVLEPSGDPLGGLGVSGGASKDFWRDLVEILGELGAKMVPRWTQDGPSWQQVAPKMGHDGAKMAILRSVWELLGGSWEHCCSHFLRFLEKWPKCKNEQHSNTFAVFLGGVGASSGGSWRLSWERFGGYVGRCWLQDGVFLAILGDVWTSWRQGWRTRAQDAADDRKSWRPGGGEGVMQGTRRISGTPPLRNCKGRGWSSHLHLELPTPPGNS